MAATEIENSSEEFKSTAPDFSKWNVGSTSSIQCFPTEYCSVHSDRLLEKYCKTHDEVICSICVSLSHRACQNMHSIPDEIDSLYKPETFNETTRQLHNIKKTMEDIKKAKEIRIKDSTKYKTEAIDSVKKFRKEMEAVLEKIENELVKKVETECDSLEVKLQNDITEVRKGIYELEQSANKHMKSVGNKAQEFVCVKSSEKNIHKAKDLVNLLQKQQGDILSVDSVTQEFLQKLNILSKVSVSDRTYTMKQQKEVNIKLPNDTDCNVFGACFIDDGSLLLADFGNIRLKRVDLSSDSIKDYIETIDCPVGICQTIPNDIAVSLYNGVIQLVSVGEEMVKYKKLNLGHFIFSLAYKNGKLFVTDQHYALYVYDMNGSLLRTIGLDNDGNKIFTECRHIVLGTIFDKVYVFDKDKGMITFGPRGDYESTFTGPDLLQIRSAAADKRGNIFVCSVNSLNIVQINEQSKRKISVIDRELAGEFPTEIASMSFNPDRNTLVATHSGSTITVYELNVTNA
ncbi:uncharacterized protein LOC123528014 [Mercenaria mercenaria]|uniref:uncharacterized protein LOC123528014 n=1 Tax=Mercenaria mercenaria TaxID=6596 RepID=UPI00234F4158|nr:uncharacterized protein LOC123528014 [Mercenaria mercenaria]